MDEELMGAWGYGWRDNDNYYNGVDWYVQPLVEALADNCDEYDDLQDLRARFMWTVYILRDVSDKVRFTDSQIDVFRKGITHIREEAQKHSSGWREPKEYLAKVEEELHDAEEWLDRFKEVGFLEDRIGPLIETVSEKDS